ncbi:DUF1796 family putative cysteine peptidase [Paenibacillus arenosi]|uniref:Peptidase n=1 Tax=Paenibacillus arenosi TaxID=2774142 RepID=A0ABR9ATG7_9BACL|nr:DUF1796 family putative cysteine peptidase [Paenibacillus arenosi]MBD8497413.1 peptidase [Paenibacillus arenosi]
MNLAQVRGGYDAIYSLGSSCLPAIKLQSRNLRPCSGPLDWMTSRSLPHVNRLLEAKFKDFLSLKHITITGDLSYQKAHYIVQDTFYQVSSVHDFDVYQNTLAELKQYPEVISKLNRRIKRMLDDMSSGKRILFIRTEESGNYPMEETLHILDKQVAGSYVFLYIRQADVFDIMDCHHKHPSLCVVLVPRDPVWYFESTWDNILNSIYVND